jgi:hypothetical protein
MSDKVIATFLWMETLRERIEFKEVNPVWYRNIKASGLPYYQHAWKIRYVKGDKEFSEKVIKWIQTAILIALDVRINNAWFGLGSHPLSDLNEKGPVRLIAFIESQKTTTVNYPKNISDYLVQQFQVAFPEVVTIKAEQDKEEHELNYTPELQQQELLIKKQKQQEIKENEERELLLNQAKQKESVEQKFQEERAQVEEQQQIEKQKRLAAIALNAQGLKSQEDQDKENEEQQKREQETQNRKAELAEREAVALKSLEQQQQQVKLTQTAKFEKIDEKFIQEQDDLSKKINEKREERQILLTQQLENEKLRETQQREEEFREREREKLREKSTPVPKLDKEEQPLRIAQWWSYIRGVPANVPQLQENAPQLQQIFQSQDVLVAFINNPDHRLSPESLSVLSDAIRNANGTLPATESKESRDFWAQATQKLNDKQSLLKSLDDFMRDHDMAVYVH